MQGQYEAGTEGSDTELDERVRTRAYEIWEEEGRPDGQADAHWERAEREAGETEGSAAAGFAQNQSSVSAPATAGSPLETDAAPAHVLGKASARNH